MEVQKSYQDIDILHLINILTKYQEVMLILVKIFLLKV